MDDPTDTDIALIAVLVAEPTVLTGEALACPLAGDDPDGDIA